MHEVARIARRELWGFFASPVAYIFLGAFLAVNLFVFFWVEAFFARNLADARSLFEWMPVLLIFLAAALTMRLWSEERRAGTLETLLTLPVSPLRLVLGKFLAALALVAVALALTLPLPITISFLGPLDWGPVLGAYLATLLLAAAYIAIGLFVSARTDNPIVSLIGSTLLCGLFFLLGSETLTGLFGHRGGELLELLGSGSRFESITRGVIDLRDLYFYLGIVGLFLALNVYSLERLRWAEDTAHPGHHRRWALVTGLLAANLLAANLWLHRIDWIRADITQGRIYSVSEATRNYLAQLREPLLIRGYFSARTHPLLAPLVPQIRDLLREYELVGDGKVQVEFIDPMEEQELEREAGERYGIRPVAFQTASKYQAAVVNSYFDLLVQYGGQHEKLGFRDLIEVKDSGAGDLEVRLRNPEYDITRTIKKLLYGYRGGGDIFQGLTKPVAFHGYISATDKLPEPLPGLLEELQAMLAELTEQANGKFTSDIRDPDASDGALRQEIAERFGFRPLVLGLLDPRTFYFSMVLESGDQAIPIPLPEELDKAGLQRAIEAGIKRFAPGFLKTVALYTPPQAGGGFMAAPVGLSYSALEEHLTANLTLKKTELGRGTVPEDADLLLVAGPQGLDEKQVFAIDQFLMQGGTVILAASPYHLDLGGNALSARSRLTGLEEWLAHQGIALEPTLVLDRRSTPFPIPVQRQVAGFLIEEIRNIAYPYFPDIRDEGMDQETGITSGLGQITLNWASPIKIDPEKNQDRRVVELLKSSADSWTDASEDIQPDFDAQGPLGFAVGGNQDSRPLAVVVQGRFGSFFAGKPSPLLAEPEEEAPEDEDPVSEPDRPEAVEKAQPPIAGVVETSPPSARLILIGSASFLTDTAIGLATEATRTLYTKPLELIQNALDWSLEDRGLLSLRGRGQYSRLLIPLTRNGQMIWEYLNYALALAGLALVYVLYRRGRRRRRSHYRTVMSAGRSWVMQTTAMQTTTAIQDSAVPAKVSEGVLRSPLVIALGGLLLLQLLATFLLGVGEQEMGPAASEGPLLDFDPAQVTGIRIRSSDGEPVLVTKTEDGWIIPALKDLPAAKHKVTGLLSKLQGLQKGLPVATSEAALERFRVADRTFERKLVLERGDAPPAILYLGDSPGFRRLFVRADGDGAVYEAELGLFDAPDRPDNWSDRTLLHLKPEAVRRLAFAGLTLERTDDDWRLTDLAEGEAQDQQAIEDRVRTLTTIDFIGVLAEEEKPAIDTESAPIEFEATLTDGETLRYRVTKLAEGNDYLLEVSNRPQDFTLASYVAKDLTKLRRSDLVKARKAAEESAEDGDE